MNDNLRKEIISHIEASGELACWITPYLYHAAYQAVKELERDGTIIVEVGKRGEPVYVFAHPTALGAAPATTALFDTRNSFAPNAPFENIIAPKPNVDPRLTLTPISQLQNGDRVGYYSLGKYVPVGKVDRVEIEGWAATLIVDNGVDLLRFRRATNDVWYVEPKDDPKPAPARAADDAAEAVPGIVAKLAEKYARPLRNIAKHGMLRSTTHNSEYAVHWATAKALMNMGLVEWTDRNCDYVRITEAGKAALS